MRITEKLMDLMKTRYITDDHVQMLGKVLEKIDRIDLYHCRFTPGAHRILQTYYATVDMHNSENPNLEWILQHNCQAKQGSFKTLPKEKLQTDWISKGDISTYLSKLRTNVLYTLEDSKVSSISLVIVIMLQYPQIFIDLGTFILDVFQQVRMDWLQNKRSHSEYWLLIGMAVKRLQKDENGMFVLPDGSKLNEKLLVRVYTVLPRKFGMEKLYETSEFQEVWSKSIKSLAYIREEERAMKDYLEINE